VRDAQPRPRPRRWAPRPLLLRPAPALPCAGPQRNARRLAPPEDSEDGEFFYNEEEVAAGAGGDERAARLSALDALLTMPRADQLDEVRALGPRTL
jgi:hypothetical protein